MAEGPAQNHLILVADQYDRAGRFARADRLLDGRRDGGERLGKQGCGSGPGRKRDGRHGRKQKMKSEAGHGTRRHPMRNEIPP